MGLSDATLIGQSLLLQRRRELNSDQQTQRSGEGWLSPFRTVVACVDRQTVENEPQATRVADVEKVRCYPSLALAAMKERREATFRLWQLGRYFDPDGAGWIDERTVREMLCDDKSADYCFTWRRARQLFVLGDGIFWGRERGRLWLYSAARVARNLSVERLEGKPVYVRVGDLTGGIRQVRAVLTNAFHSGRQHQNPISRATLRSLSSWSESTQRQHEAVSGVTVKGNIAVSEVSADKLTAQLWQRGGGVFEFFDNRDQRLKLAWCLPNTYTGSLARARRGRNKKINQQLRFDLVNTESGGTDSSGFTRLFHETGAQAAKSACKGTADAYWRDNAARSGVGVWRCWAV